MPTGAVIAAAGISARMMQFQQFMNIGSQSMAERVIVNFQQAGVEEIVIVTGYRSRQLEKGLHRYQVTFLKNEAYKTTDMLETAKIGFRYLENHCSRVLFCPVDIPFFMAKTVRQMLAQQGDVILPVNQGRAGHPILIHASLIPLILQYHGENGLKGALDSIEGLVRVQVPVDDEAVLMDVNTREDYRRLLDLHNASLMRPEVQVGIASQKLFFSHKTMELLRQIDTLGSVREACLQLGISYSKGWALIHDAEDGVGCRIVERWPGGRNGGMAGVTPKGKKLAGLFEQYENLVSQAAEDLFRDIFFE